MIGQQQNNSVDKYYVNICPQKMIINPLYITMIHSDTAYRVGLFQGTRQISIMKQAVIAGQHQGLIKLNKIPLELSVQQNYKEKHHRSYSIRVYEIKKKMNENIVGTYTLQLNQYIAEYQENNIRFSSYKVPFGTKYQLRFQVFIEKTKAGLQRFLQQHRAIEHNDQIMINNSSITIEPLLDQCSIQSRNKIRRTSHTRKPLQQNQYRRHSHIRQSHDEEIQTPTYINYQNQNFVKLRRASSDIKFSLFNSLKYDKKVESGIVKKQEQCRSEFRNEQEPQLIRDYDFRIKLHSTKIDNGHNIQKTKQKYPSNKNGINSSRSSKSNNLQPLKQNQHYKIKYFIMFCLLIFLMIIYLGHSQENKKSKKDKKDKKNKNNKKQKKNY